MRASYEALYAQLGHHRPAWGTEASAPLDALTTAQILDLELPDSLHLTDLRANGMAWLESKQNANGSWTGAVPQGERRRAGDRARVAGDARLRRRLHREYLER